jgi:hypothetical protein
MKRPMNRNKEMHGALVTRIYALDLKTFNVILVFCPKDVHIYLPLVPSLKRV